MRSTHNEVILIRINLFFSLNFTYLFAALEPTVNLNLNLNGANNADRNLSVMYGTGLRTRTLPPPAPAISVVTFRWDDDKIKHNKGEPDR